MFVHIKTFKQNKITYCIVNLLNLKNTRIQVCKLLYTLQGVVVSKEKQNLNFKEKLLELLSVFFHITSLSSEDNKWYLNDI